MQHTAATLRMAPGHRAPGQMLIAQQKLLNLVTVDPRPSRIEDRHRLSITRRSEKFFQDRGSLVSLTCWFRRRQFAKNAHRGGRTPFARDAANPARDPGQIGKMRIQGADDRQHLAAAIHRLPSRPGSARVSTSRATISVSRYSRNAGFDSAAQSRAAPRTGSARGEGQIARGLSVCR